MTGYWRFLSVCLIAVALVGCGKTDKIYQAAVDDIVDNNILVLSNGRSVCLAGIEIPVDEGYSNYNPGLADEFRERMIGKKVRYRIVARLGERYPVYDLIAILEEDGSALNEQLLRAGKAFFDEGQYRGRRKYKELEAYARAQKLGIWRDPSVGPLVVSKKGWRRYHYPECPLVSGLDPGERVDFYVLPPVVFGGRVPAFSCKYCQQIEAEKGRPFLFRRSEELIEQERAVRGALSNNLKLRREEQH